MTQQNNSTRSIYLKVISVVTIMAFFCTDLLFFPSQAFAQPVHSSQAHGGTDTALLASVSASCGNVQDFVIPPELGSITDEFRVRSSELGGKKVLGTQNSGRPTVILIQDAHAIPEAQTSLEKLVEYLQGQYGVRTVALEGAEGKLDPRLFRTYPNAKKLKEVFEQYLENGELSGAAVASVLSPYLSDYVGIEDWELYQDGVAAFLRGLDQQAGFNMQVTALNERIQKLKKEFYSPEARE